MIHGAGQEEQFAQLTFAAGEYDELLLQLQFGENVAWSAVQKKIGRNLSEQKAPANHYLNTSASNVKQLMTAS